MHILFNQIRSSPENQPHVNSEIFSLNWALIYFLFRANSDLLDFDSLNFDQVNSDHICKILIRDIKCDIIKYATKVLRNKELVIYMSQAFIRFSFELFIFLNQESPSVLLDWLCSLTLSLQYFPYFLCSFASNLLCYTWQCQDCYEECFYLSIFE